MPTHTEILADKTHSDVEEIERRIFYTLTDSKDLQAHRTAKFVALLAAQLSEQGLLDGHQLDEMLLEAAL